MDKIPVVDVFAGPGGLNEGFARLARRAESVFDVVASFEMEPNAVDTLRMRSAVRALETPGEPYRPYREFLNGERSLGSLLADESFRSELRHASEHVHQLELGPETRSQSDARIQTALRGRENWVLVGGPPCQAYSLVGRARRTHDETFLEDKKHFLYREYLHIIQKHRPAVFVMENVKGLLSAGHSGESMIDLILSDLRGGETYDIHSLVVDTDTPEPRDFVIRAEQFGVPQRRHRVILVGTRRERGLPTLRRLEPDPLTATVWQAISDMPSVESRVSRPNGNAHGQWEAARRRGEELAEALVGSAQRVDRHPNPRLNGWLKRNWLAGFTLHEPRSHMTSDLSRYAYLARAAERGMAPKVYELPLDLRPHHLNVTGLGTPFPDRFKVQQWDHPSSTVASHISKDGHYYIHPDPRQMRSLTVREAARLQTFPDDYFFRGNRTMQYHQVGNAVPPLLAHQIAERVAELLER